MATQEQEEWTCRRATCRDCAPVKALKLRRGQGCWVFPWISCDRELAVPIDWSRLEQTRCQGNVAASTAAEQSHLSPAKVSENPTNDDQTCATRAQQLPPHCSLSSLFVGAIWVAHLQLRMQTSTPLQWADRVCMVAWSFTVVLTHALRSCSMSGMEMGQIDTGGGEEGFQPALRMQTVQSALCLRPVIVDIVVDYRNPDVDADGI
ncbi:hypothetical protein Anapl_08168 [Anas platyrhynchos]|uniref:Uncharacterized protein n=1 Tax=Anas platyrhynchos TaxID=8839 RepID=R0LVH9_ANAPL|nr:hypothetical protein Anapl_08168 [Anas platyrhynchos]